MYIYMYISVCMCVCTCVFWQHFFVKTYLIKLYRHLFSTYHCFNPFESLNRCYNL